ncbi:sulfatase-like hydrolase/transferase [candidate division KSB1 bacterium]|nr:sulfatase-like hydrolase/transferase [candidate division KSB1 bacterium]
MKISRRGFMRTAALSAASFALPFSQCAQQRKPNIILLFSDELAPEYLSCNGGEISTPNLDRLAGSGVRFTRAYTAAPMCTPSRFSVLSGKYPGRCEHKEFLESFPPDTPYSIAWNTWLTSSLPTIASELSKNGYLTGMTGKWHVGKLPESVEKELPELPADADPADEDVQKKLQQHQKIVADRVCHDAGFDQALSVSWDNFDMFPVKQLRYHNFPWITRGSVDFIREAARDQKPFFLYAATTAVHGPHHAESLEKDHRYTLEGFVPQVEKFRPPVDEIKQKLSQIPQYLHHKYAGMMELDHHVGIILDTLDELGIANNTLVAFVADHNTEPGKATCYEKGNHVPMLMTWPQRFPGEKICKEMVQSIDLFPSFLYAAGLNVKENLLLDGKSILETVLLDQPAHKFIYLESGYTRAISDGRFKYIVFRPPQNSIEQMKTGTSRHAPNHLDVFKQAHSQIALTHYPHYFDPDQLYDLENDPYEQINLIDDPKHHEMLKTLKSELEKRLRSFEHPFSLEIPDFMLTDAYKQLAENTRAIGTDYIAWLPRDHGKIVWPPE